MDQVNLRASLLAVCFGIVSLYTIYATHVTHDELFQLAVLVGLGHPLVITGLVTAYVVRTCHHPHASILLGTAGIGAMLLGGLGAFFGVSVMFGQESVGGQIVTPSVVVTNLVLSGGFAGLLIGHFVGLNRIQYQREQIKTQQLGVLTRVLGHNIRNDLNIALGNIDDAKSDAAGRPRGYLDMASDALEHLLSSAELIRDAQEFLESPQVSNQNLVSITERTVSEIQRQYPGESIQFHKSTPGLEVSAPDGVSLVVTELLTNACEHGDDPIDVLVYEANGSGNVEIRDQGPGIPKYESEILITGEESELLHGSGVGLWLAKWFVEQSNGEFKINSDDGTTVTLSFPRA